MLKKEIATITLVFALIFALSSCNMLSFASQGESAEPPAAIFVTIDENADTPSTDLIEAALIRFTHESATDIYTSFAQLDYKTDLPLEEICNFLNEKIVELGAAATYSQGDELAENVLWYYSGAYHNNSVPITVLVEEDGEFLHVYISLY